MSTISESLEVTLLDLPQIEEVNKDLHHFLLELELDMAFHLLLRVPLPSLPYQASLSSLMSE